jgi:outer membrane assembly lipoprotein YfiO
MGRIAVLGTLILFTVGLGCASHAVTVRLLPPTERAGYTSVPNPTLDQAEALLNAHEYKSARKLLVYWLKADPHAPDRDRAIFLMARWYTNTGDLIKAFYQYDELLDNLPGSPLYYQALENQYNIADALLNGYKAKFLWFHLISGEDQAIEMLFRIQERSPGSPLAERAMWRTADYYYRSSQFDLAYDVYNSYLRAYPRSALVPRALLRRAFSSLAQFRGLPFDATPLLDARSQFQDIIARYPSLAAEENLPDIIELIDRTMAEKMLRVAKFYAWVGKPGAAVYTYRSLVELYPNSRESQVARKDLQHMPAWALAEALPPATQPSDSPSLTVPLQ